MNNLDAKQKFLGEFDHLIKELSDIVASYNLPEEARNWFIRNLKYNAKGGKLNRGLAVIDTYLILNNKSLEDLTTEEYRRIALLGWCIELLQAYFLVADDMMDQSKTRRGQPCWYLLEGVGNIAINDSFMLEAAIYVLLKKYFRSEQYYVDLLDLLHEITFKTELGQLVDLITADEDVVDLSKFTLENHSLIVVYKTAYYSFYLPVVLAMHMCGVSDERDLKQAQEILIPLGKYFQIQDDYLDCFGSPEQIGKIGTDIQDNKCSWVINIALLHANPDQRKILDDNYGRKDSEAENRCKKVFSELKIPDIYNKYEESVVVHIKRKIEHVDDTRGLKKQVFTAFLQKIYKRSV